MIKKILLFLLFLTATVFSQTSRNTNLIGNINYGRFTNDVWGYTDPQGTDYAIVGLEDGVSIVKVNSDNLEEIDFVPGVSSIWRDMKTHDHYVYVTNETGGGIDIIDLSPLPDSVRYVGSYGDALKAAHNLYISGGYAYISGSDDARGADILDLANPEAPTKVGEWTEHYFHDIYVRNDTLFGSAGGSSSLVLLDVSDKSQPKKIVEIPFPDAGYSHNAWTTEDGKYVMTTQETLGKTVKMWDIRDPFNAEIVGQYLASPSRLAHNTHILGDFAYISHYGDGLRILDISDPTDLVEVGYYDTHPDDQGGFEGNWGAFPFTASGYIYATDEDFGLFVISFNGTRAMRLRGRVLDAQTGQPVPGVTLEIEEIPKTASSDSQGNYRLGFPNPGLFTIRAYSFFYDTTTVTFTAVEGQSDLLDIMVNLRRTGRLSGTIMDASGQVIDNAQIELLQTPLELTKSQSDGSFSFAGVPEGTYLAAIGRWGFQTGYQEVTVLPNQQIEAKIILNAGYADDFELDLGWQVSDRSGNRYPSWQIMDPREIGFGLPFNPTVDFSDEPGTQAYFVRTFNSELSLTSPTFDLTSSLDPAIRYQRHWFPRGQNGDSLVVDISSDNGATWAPLAAFSDADATQGWKETIHLIPAAVSKTAEMRVRFTTKEKGLLSCFALLDEFEVLQSADNFDSTIPHAYSIQQNYPNPFNPTTTIRYSLPAATHVRLKIYDLLGREVRVLVNERQSAGVYEVPWNGRDTSGRRVASGVYFYRLETDGLQKTTRMLLMQ